MSEPAERVQTRPKNLTQHPGLVIPKRKRRTQAEMNEARERERAEKEALEREHTEKLALLEDTISRQDRKSIAGTETYVRPRPTPRTKKPAKVLTQIQPEEPQVEDEVGEVEFVDQGDADDDDDGMYLDEQADADDEDKIDEEIEEDEEDEDEAEVQPKKKKRVVKNLARQAVEAYRSAQVVASEGAEGIAESTKSVSTFNKAAAGAIKNWSSAVQAPISASAPAVRTSSTRSSTLVAVKAQKPTKAQKPLSEPLPLVTLSDEEWLTNKPSKNVPIKVEEDNLVGGSLQVGRATRKFVNGDLPAGCDRANSWRRVYIPSYIHFVASYSDPWFVSDDDAVEAMQQTWDAVFTDGKFGMSIPHVVDVHGAVFSITNQRIYEWRAAFGSVAVAVINTFFDSEHIDTNEARVAFATSQLGNLAFLYSAPGGGKTPNRGLFRGPIVVQTFATHFSAILGGIKVPSLDINEPECALALSVEHAYTLWQDGAISIESASSYDETGRAISRAVIKSVNATTGKESTKDKAFNEMNWGKVTRDYLTSVKENLLPGSFKDIVKLAGGYLKENQRGGSTQSSLWAGAKDNVRAVLVDIPDED